MSNHFRPRSGFSNTDFSTHSVPIMKMRLENEIIRKREAENKRSETARSNDRYFQQWNLQTEKFDDWTSPRSMHLTHHQSIKLGDSDIEIETRRTALKKIYKIDKAKQEQDLKKLQEEAESLRWDLMKEKILLFKQSKSVRLKEAIEHKEHEQWKSTSLSYQAFESELKKEQQQQAWKLQLQYKEDEKVRLADEKRREAAQIECMIREGQQLTELEQKLELEKKKKLKMDLEKQIEMLRYITQINSTL